MKNEATELLEKKIAEVEGRLNKISKIGKTGKEILGLSDDAIEGIYAEAYRLYNAGAYDKALDLFWNLAIIDPAEAKFIMGIAACYHMQKDYKSAARFYTIVSTLDPVSPIAFYHASDCYINLKDPVSAYCMLEMAIRRAENTLEYATLKDRAILTKEHLKKKIV